MEWQQGSRLGPRRQALGQRSGGSGAAPRLGLGTCARVSRASSVGRHLCYKGEQMRRRRRGWRLPRAPPKTPPCSRPPPRPVARSPQGGLSPSPCLRCVLDQFREVAWAPRTPDVGPHGATAKREDLQDEELCQRVSAASVSVLLCPPPPRPSALPAAVPGLAPCSVATPVLPPVLLAPNTCQAAATLGELWTRDGGGDLLESHLWTVPSL